MVKDMRSAEELNKSRRSAGIAAKNKLAEKYSEEFRELLRVELEARGFQIEPTPEEKAEKRLRELLAEYPQLGEKLHQEHLDAQMDAGAV